MEQQYKEIHIDERSKSRYIAKIDMGKLFGRSFTDVENTALRQQMYFLEEQLQMQNSETQGRVFNIEQLKSMSREQRERLILDEMREFGLECQIHNDMMELKDKCNSGEVIFISESYAQKLDYNLQPLRDAFSNLGYQLLVLSESMKMALQRMDIQIALDPELKDKLNRAISNINFDFAIVNLRNRFDGCKLSDMLDMEPLDISPEIEIANLKRRLKYAKNPLERKNINRELNTLYKERKYRRDK